MRKVTKRCKWVVCEGVIEQRVLSTHRDLLLAEDSRRRFLRKGKFDVCILPTEEWLLYRQGMSAADVTQLLAGRPIKAVTITYEVAS